VNLHGDIDRGEGRNLFGADPGRYDWARPDYPTRVYEVLRERCGLGPSTRVLEIGAGTGQVTHRLIEFGADPVVAVEPDESLAAHLSSSTKDFGARVDVRVAAFEDVELPDAWFDLALAATAFHWVDQVVGLRRAAQVLRPGGWWAMWWNVFGDPTQPDPFHEATTRLLSHLSASPSAGAKGRPPFALDVEARRADLGDIGGFQSIDHELVRWTAHFDVTQIRALYATFSPISRLEHDERERLLDEIARVAKDEFNGRVARRMVTALYTAQRP